MRWVKSLLRDEGGALLSAEAALLGTVGVLGAGVGLHMAAGAVNDELRDVAYAFRSLDQSYCVSGFYTCGAWTAGSSFRQEPVEISLTRMRDHEKVLRQRLGDVIVEPEGASRQEAQQLQNADDAPDDTDEDAPKRRNDWGAD